MIDRFYTACAPDVLAMSPLGRRNRRRVMLQLGAICATPNLLVAALLSFGLGASALEIVVAVAATSAGGFLGGAMWGHLEATAQPPNRSFAPKE